MSAAQHDELVALFAEDIAVWARVHASSEWHESSEAIQNLAHRLVRIVEAERYDAP